jgi:hypothetical protein
MLVEYIAADSAGLWKFYKTVILAPLLAESQCGIRAPLIMARVFQNFLSGVLVANY